MKPSSDRCSSSVPLESSDDGQNNRGDEDIFQYHLDLLTTNEPVSELSDARLAPIIAGPLLRHHKSCLHREIHREFWQFGLLAGITSLLESNVRAPTPGPRNTSYEDPRLLFNVSSPSSTFICGSQGSGKSHTLSCMLENCLIPSRAGHLPSPLTGMVFHYDTFISDTVGSPCEAAFLSSHPDVTVRVLCSPTNIQSIRVCVPITIYIYIYI